MEEGNGMMASSYILMYQNWWCLISPHLLQLTSITSHSCNIHHGPYIMGFSIKVQINNYATKLYECQSFNEKHFFRRQPNGCLWIVSNKIT
jgi:hypothetical protein